jgi:sRNA-binding carbon storage regulator CsrA
LTATSASIQGDKVRLGFTAPASVTIDREEIHRRRAALADPAPAEIAGGCPCR